MLRVDRTKQEALAAPSWQCETRLSLNLLRTFRDLMRRVPLPTRSRYEVLAAAWKHLDDSRDVGSLATTTAIEAHLQIFLQPHMHSFSRNSFDTLTIDAQVLILLEWRWQRNANCTA